MPDERFDLSARSEPDEAQRGLGVLLVPRRGKDDDDASSPSMHPGSDGGWGPLRPGWLFLKHLDRYSRQSPGHGIRFRISLDGRQ